MSIGKEVKQSSRFLKMENIPRITEDALQYDPNMPARILIVDDEDIIRESLKEFLRSLGYHIFTSADPFQTLDIIKNQFIHVVILDLCLPKMDGIELQKKINMLSPKTMLIIITGYESLDSALLTLKAGAYDYLTKPIRLATLENVVKNCLEKQKLEVENDFLLKQLKQTCEQLKEREKALEVKASEADYYLNNILEKANDIIFTLDIDGQFTYVNPKIESLGFKRDTLIGTSFFSLLSEKTDAVWIYRSIKKEKPEEWALLLRDKNGEPRQMFISTSPLYDACFRLIGVLGIAMDMSHQGRLTARFKDAPKTLESDQKKYALDNQNLSDEKDHFQEYNRWILSGIPIGVALFNDEYKTLQANLAFMDLFCLKFEEVINRHIAEYLPHQIFEKLEVALKSAIRNTSTIGPIKIEFKDNQGQHKTLGLKLIPAMDSGAAETNYLLVIEDLTGSGAKEKELYRSEKMNSVLQLATGVAHEIRNPLSIILGSIQYLRSITGQVDKDIIEHLSIMAESCELIESIINELLNFARPGSMVFTLIDINECLKKTVSLLKYRCHSRHVEVRLELDPDVPLINCDAQFVGQVFINLIVNAIQSMPNGGKLTVRTQNETFHQGILILFQDSGTGIESDDLDKIFQPFFSKRSKGIGLGLTVTKRIIEEHYGKIWVESKKGKGTRVFIQLPYRMQKLKGEGGGENESYRYRDQ